MTPGVQRMKVSVDKIDYYLPPKIEDNGLLQSENPDWRMDDIVKKTGILKRHICEEGQTALDMGALAADKLFSSPEERRSIGFLIFVTQSPDYLFPTSACILQDRLGLDRKCLAFDVNLGCSGFVDGLAIGASLIESGLAERGLVICGETYSRYIQKTDRTCRPIFGDGAAAVLLSRSAKPALGPFDFGTDGSGYQDLIVKSGGARGASEAKAPCSIFMDGAKVFMFTMDAVPKTMQAVLDKAGAKLSDVDQFIFHQASKLVIENIIRRLDLPPEKVFLNMQDIGNTVSASIPIALKDASRQKRIKNGDLLMLVGFGVGYSWGSCLLEWGEAS